LGANYFVAPDTSIGVYWQSKQHFTFNDAIVYSPAAIFDVNMDLPSNIGFGVANSSLMDGNLLLTADLLYKQWSQTDLFGQIYDDQWTCQFGAQYALTPQMKLRMGYAYNQNPMKSPGATTVRYCSAGRGSRNAIHPGTIRRDYAKPRDDRPWSARRAIARNRPGHVCRVRIWKFRLVCHNRCHDQRQLLDWRRADMAFRCRQVRLC